MPEDQSVYWKVGETIGAILVAVGAGFGFKRAGVKAEESKALRAIKNLEREFESLMERVAQIEVDFRDNRREDRDAFREMNEKFEEFSAYMRRTINRLEKSTVSRRDYKDPPDSTHKVD